MTCFPVSISAREAASIRPSAVSSVPSLSVSESSTNARGERERAVANSNPSLLGGERKKGLEWNCRNGAVLDLVARARLERGRGRRRHCLPRRRIGRIFCLAGCTCSRAGGILLVRYRPIVVR